MTKTRLKELGGVLIDYLNDVGVRISRLEINDLLTRGGVVIGTCEIDAVLAELCRTGRLVRVGTIKSVPDREDGMYCLPAKKAGSMIVEGSIKPVQRSRYSVVRGAPPSELTRRRSNDAIVESSGGRNPSRKHVSE